MSPFALLEDFSRPGLDYFHALDRIDYWLSQILGCDVDVIEEPLQRDRFQREIDRDLLLAFC